MNLFQKWILGKELVERIQLKRDPAIHTAIKYLVQNGRLVTPADNKQNYIQEGYNKNAIVYAVLNKILNKAVLPEWGLYKVVDEKKYKQAEKLLLTKDLNFKQIKKALLVDNDKENHLILLTNLSNKPSTYKQAV